MRFTPLRRRPPAVALTLAFLIVASITRADDSAPSFNRDVRPILAEHCYQCHGPDGRARKGGLRLDLEAAATSPADSGAKAIDRTCLETSELLVRILATEDDERMPPPESGKRLSEAQLKTLRRWIEDGARWEQHWSLIPPRRPEVPQVRTPDWTRSPIDAFLLARLERERVSPAPEAPREALIRRLSLDLIGLPPTPEEVDAYLTDLRPEADDRLVDRLLASPHFGERMAIRWLDLVRFADTVGYHSDVPRSIALYRDYVINAFNANRPFDRFTIEQLAGDLLPDASDWTRVASAYNMLGMTTEEGGAQPKEYIARHAADRVRNLGSAWMGATLGCVECHDHKYDPYTMRDFYGLAAFFADLQEPGVGTPRPTLDLEAPLGQPRKTIVSQSGPPRVTRILHRGDWMDETGEILGPGVPRFVRPITTASQRPTRLDLARWLVDPAHPQTARVFVNRLWHQFFGAGLAPTLDDLGAQGEWPSHPELLDWLAVEFVESGWDIKHMIRLIVRSSAYRQSSTPRPELAASDASNRLLARQSSFRLEAELIRDSALAVSGLLTRRIGGESVRPYQPTGYWRFLNFPTREYVASQGPDQYRRGLYTHWQRTLLHPSMLAFDAPSREMCVARRAVSNTPGAALAALNDPTYVEAARALASLCITDASPVEAMFRRVLGRRPADTERTILHQLADKHRREFAAAPGEARRLLGVGEEPLPGGADPVELAALTSVARTLLNLDETLTRD